MGYEPAHLAIRLAAIVLTHEFEIGSSLKNSDETPPYIRLG